MRTSACIATTPNGRVHPRRAVGNRIHGGAQPALGGTIGSVSFQVLLLLTRGSSIVLADTAGVSMLILPQDRQRYTGHSFPLTIVSIAYGFPAGCQVRPPRVPMEKPNKLLNNPGRTVDSTTPSSSAPPHHAQPVGISAFIVASKIRRTPNAKMTYEDEATAESSLGPSSGSLRFHAFLNRLWIGPAVEYLHARKPCPQ